MRQVILLFVSAALLFSNKGIAAKEVTFTSPDKKLKAVINTDKTVSLKVFDATRELFAIDGISIDTDRGIFPAANAKVRKTDRKTVSGVIVPPIKEKQASIPENYNEATVVFSGGISLQFRLYNDGFAYRMLTELPGEVTVKRENALFSFDRTATLTFQNDTTSQSHNENPYISMAIGALTSKQMGNLPALVELPESKRLLFLEADVADYPCMWIKGDDGRVSIHQWNYPDRYSHDIGNTAYYTKNVVISSRDYLAKVQGTRTWPWRIIAIADKDIDLMHNQLVYLLGPAQRVNDVSWIKPGWVMFDWWGKHGIYGVPFKSGINTETAKYMIDFCHAFGMKYYLFDDGWTRDSDLTKVIPGLDMEEVVAYGKSKNVDIMLWVAFSLFDEQMEEAMVQFDKWGIKGLKIDFMARSDQEVVNFYWRSAEIAARYKMVVNFHGAYKPDGLRRAYPNVLTREALIEFEFNGWTDYVTPAHDCTLPFIRNVAGPQDYIPGTMFNATKDTFRPIGPTPMGQGTRAHSMAMAVISESPMQMLPDAPTWYYREEECARFLTQIPVEWDQIEPLDGKVGHYVAVARRSEKAWYVAAITNWDARKLSFRFDFLDDGRTYDMELIKDGPNADKMAVDYVKEQRKIRKGDVIEADMAPGGGWIAHIY